MMRIILRRGVCVPGARKETPMKKGCESEILVALGQVTNTGIAMSQENTSSAPTAAGFRPMCEVTISGFVA
jgi:hypothetical protein